ncbi:plasma membrane ATPase 4 [Ceratobasidium sp. AG-Ba]|nr:plasma membrane ATPase 4 [Ceratobasidium sp. AG-Ba]
MSNIEIDKYPCFHCPAFFSNSEAHTVHYIETHEGAGPSAPRPNTGMFHCRHCGRSKKTHQGLSQRLQKDCRCKKIQERWIQRQVAQSGVSPRRSRTRANTLELDMRNNDSDNQHNERVPGRNMEVMRDDERHVMREGSMARSADDADNGGANYPSDQDSIPGLQEEIRDSDVESNTGLTDIPSDHSPARTPPRTPP